MQMPRTITRGCEDNGCDDPLCMAAVRIQQELPMLDFHAARMVAIQERDVPRLKDQIKVRLPHYHKQIWVP